MRYTLTFLESQYDELIKHLFGEPDKNEKAAFLLCGLSHTDNELRLLVRGVIAVPSSDLLSHSPHQLCIPARSFLPVMKQADREKAAFCFVHSHPEGFPEHSEQDDREESALFRTAYNRISTAGAVHGSIVISDPALPRGRIWLDHDGTMPIDMIRVIGRRFRFYSRPSVDQATHTSFYDREVRAFGPDILPLLQKLTIGIAGAGGTGSPVIEQLIRLGVGRLIIADGQTLEQSNISRVYGSEVDDVGMFKGALMSRLARHIGLGTHVEIGNRPITFESVLKQFRDCDIVFGCTDDQWGRAVLSQFSIAYCIPVFDLGVKIDSDNGTIRSIPGRISTLMPGLRCLYCRGQITAEGVSAEVISALSPTEAAERRRQGYIPELAEAEPAVIAFTTATAGFAVAELLNRLTGYKKDGHGFNEILIRFDETAIKKPGSKPVPGCFCTKEELIGRGDRRRFLDQTWRPE